MGSWEERLSLAGFRLGWRAVRWMPERLAYWTFDRIAERTYAAGGKDVRSMRANYARLRPELPEQALEDLVRLGLRSYMRYWCDAFRLPDRDEAWIGDHVETIGDDRARAVLAEGKGFVAFLGHLGNWDLAGAWACQDLAPVTTVAERLKPEELYEEFVAFREQLGMTVLPLTGERGGPFGDLARALRGGGFLPLLSDRDLTDSGVEVELVGLPARVAGGPAMLSLATGMPLFVILIRYAPHRDGGHGIVIEFHGPIEPDDAVQVRRQQVADMTQRCVDLMESFLVEHTEDWHMMQRVFVADLDRRG